MAAVLPLWMDICFFSNQMVHARETDSMTIDELQREYVSVIAKRRGGDKTREAISLLQSIIAQDPNHQPALLSLAFARLLAEPPLRNYSQSANLFQTLVGLYGSKKTYLAVNPHLLYCLARASKQLEGASSTFHKSKLLADFRCALSLQRQNMRVRGRSTVRGIEIWNGTHIDDFMTREMQGVNQTLSQEIGSTVAHTSKHVVHGLSSFRDIPIAALHWPSFDLESSYTEGVKLIEDSAFIKNHFKRRNEWVNAKHVFDYNHHFEMLPAFHGEEQADRTESNPAQSFGSRLIIGRVDATSIYDPLGYSKAERCLVPKAKNICEAAENTLAITTNIFNTVALLRISPGTEVKTPEKHGSNALISLWIGLNKASSHVSLTLGDESRRQIHMGKVTILGHGPKVFSFHPGVRAAHLEDAMFLVFHAYHPAFTLHEIKEIFHSHTNSIPKEVAFRILSLVSDSYVQWQQSYDHFYDTMETLRSKTSSTHGEL